MKERLIEWALQFRNLDPNDPGRWPLLPQATVLAVVFLLALFLAWYLLWSDQVAAIEAAVAKEPQLKEQWAGEKAPGGESSAPSGAR